MSALSDEAKKIGTSTWLSPRSIFIFLIRHTTSLGNDQHPSRSVHQSAQNQASHVKSSFVDESEAIFSMYLEMAEEEDKKLAEHWQANADGILIFVGIIFNGPVLHTNSVIKDRFILCRCRVLDFRVYSGHSTKLTRHNQLLPCQYLSDSCRPKPIQCFEFPPLFPTPIFSTDVCHLGEHTLVLEFGHRYFLCLTRDVATAMGTTIPHGHSAALQHS